ncbi:MAG: HIT family protein [Bacillota bacterium]|nr:HIT family protein [Bacillota bacterium]
MCSNSRSDEQKCLFCNYERARHICENQYAYAIFDNFPVNRGHVLVIPKRHFESFFEASEEEITAIYSLIKEVKERVDWDYRPLGYNIGINIGKTAGQTIAHVHIHIIPRYEGDVDNPRGGIRNLKKALIEYNG